MKKFVLLFLSLSAASMLAGCATQFSKSERPVDVVSTTPGKTFKIYNSRGDYIHQGVTPQIVVLKGHSDVFEKERYIFEVDGRKRAFMPTITPLYWFNVFGFVGFAVDGITGAMWALPSRVNIERPQYEDPTSNW